MKVLSLFSGIGAFEKAFDNLEIPYELVAYCEIDKYASKSYAAIHGVSEEKNLGDITKVDEKALPKDIDLITYGFPCQDISLAGKQKGLFNEDGTQTRSGLFFEALRIIEEAKPRVAIAENVKNLTSKKFSEQFKIVLDSLEQAGYNNYWKVLNALDYGMPQNRERVFIVSIRKDIDAGTFEFPEGFPLNLRLKDMIEDEVDEKYYLTEAMYNYCMGVGQKESKFPRKERFLSNINRPNQDVAVCISTHSGSRPVDNFLKIKDGELTQEPIDENTKVSFLKIKEATKKGYAEAYEGDSINLEYPNSTTRRGRVGNQVAQTLTTSCNQAVAVAMRGRYSEDGTIQQNIEISDREYANAITTVQKDLMIAEPIIIREEPLEREGWHRNAKEVLNVEGVCRTISTQSNNLATKIKDPKTLRIRKLTPKECYRLQGFDDSDFYKAEAVNSNTQLIKQAGNSICVPVIEHIIKALIDYGAFEIKKERGKEMELKIYNPTKDGFIKTIEWNYEEIKRQVADTVEMYTDLVYTDEQIKEAKDDRAALNRFIKALEDKRKEIKNQCLAPYESFEKQMKEIIALVKEPVALIDSQVKGYEEKKKQEKMDQVTSAWCGLTKPEGLTLEKIFDSRWLNASYSINKATDEMIAKIDKFKAEMDVLADLPEFSFEAQQVYISSLDLPKALSEAHRLADVAKKKAEHEAELFRQKAAEEMAKHMTPPETYEEEQVPGQMNMFDSEDYEPTENFIPTFAKEPEKEWAVVRVKISPDDKTAIEQYLATNNIEYKFM